MKVILLAAGHESLTIPRNLDQINGISIIEYSLESLKDVLDPEGSNLIVCLSEFEADNHFTDKLVKLNYAKATVVKVKNPTGGALCTALLASHLIGSQDALFANGDQWFNANLKKHLDAVRGDASISACTFTFNSTHPRWSYIVRDQNEDVIQVAEKNPLSMEATAGLYYFKSYEVFRAAAEKSLLKRKPINGRFFLAPALNEVILEGKKVTAFRLDGDYRSLSKGEDIMEFRNWAMRNLL